MNPSRKLSNIKTYRLLANVFAEQYELYRVDKYKHKSLMYSLYSKIEMSDSVQKNLNLVGELYKVLGRKVMNNLLEQLDQEVKANSNSFIVEHKKLFRKDLSFVAK
jgi:hypothetical protein